MRNLGSLLMKGLTMNLKLLTILILFPLQVLAKEELKVLTYGSFNSDWGPGPNIEKEFESSCNCDLIWNTADSSGALLSRVKLTKNNEGFDVLLGLDDSLITEAEENDLFIEHQIEEFNLDLNWKNKFLHHLIMDTSVLFTIKQNFPCHLNLLRNLPQEMIFLL